MKKKKACGQRCGLLAECLPVIPEAHEALSMIPGWKAEEWVGKMAGSHCGNVCYFGNQRKSYRVIRIQSKARRNGVNRLGDRHKYSKLGGIFFSPFFLCILRITTITKMVICIWYKQSIPPLSKPFCLSCVICLKHIRQMSVCLYYIIQRLYFSNYFSVETKAIEEDILNILNLSYV